MRKAFAWRAHLKQNVIRAPLCKESIHIDHTFALSFRGSWRHAGGMTARIEELLYLLLWTAEGMTRPTFRNLSESYEGWAYRSGFHRELARLERRKLLEKRPGMERIYRLTAEGRIHALGGIDPEARWARAWDGRWRLICFDIPMSENKQRLKLRRYLRQRGFGYLQNSVWVTPDRLEREVKFLQTIAPNVESLIMFEAKTLAGESTADIVTGAWDFQKINELYQGHLSILRSRPPIKGSHNVGSLRLRSWAGSERLSWRNIMAVDPLLPHALSPPGYLGRKVWHKRVKTLASVRRELERAVF